MRKYQAMYEGVSRKVEASNHIAARSLAAVWFKAHAESFNSDYLVLIDVDVAGHGAHTGHCQGCAPAEMCSRSGTCGWCYDEHRITSYVQSVAPGESVWAQIQIEELDKVHDIWCRRASDDRR